MRCLTLFLIILLMATSCFGLQKNVASQKWVVFAFDETDNTAKTGDAGNITANLRIDGAAADTIDDANPTELEDGYYVFDITNTESNGDCIVICPDSTTANIQVIGCPMSLWTTPPYFPTLSIDSNGRLDIIKVAGTTQTANDMSGDIDDVLIDTASIQPIVADLAGISEIGDKVVADMDANSVIDDILTDTAAQDTAGEWDTLMATVDGKLDTAQADLDTITGGSGVLIDTDAVDADALKTDAVTEIWAKAMSDLAGVPSATAAVLDAINWIFEVSRNKTVTNGTNNEIELYKDDGSTKFAESDISDDGTDFTKGEYGAPD